MEAAGDNAENAEVHWRLTIQGAHINDRLTIDGVVGVLQPIVVIEPSEGMTEKIEAEQWQTFMAACGRDGNTGDRLLLLKIEPPYDGRKGVLEVCHILGTHDFEIPEDEWMAVDQISKLASVPVRYKFRSQEDLIYRAVIISEDGPDPDLTGDGPELWLSRFGRRDGPNPHINAMNPISRNTVAAASPSDMYAMDLTKFVMPTKNDCVMCAQPLAGEKTNREHLVPDWMRTLVAERLGVPIAGVVAPAHERCNADHSAGEDAVKRLTMRHLAGEDLTRDELGMVAYWMGGRMTLLDRAAGIEPPRRRPLDSSFRSARGVFPPLYTGRLGDDDHVPFKTLVLGPWIYHVCWSTDGCAGDGLEMEQLP